MAIRVCLAGATGWAGSALARAIAQTDDIVLSAVISRRAAGQSLADVLGEPRLTCPVYATAAEALTQPCDVFFEYPSCRCERQRLDCPTTRMSRGDWYVGAE